MAALTAAVGTPVTDHQVEFAISVEIPHSYRGSGVSARVICNGGHEKEWSYVHRAVDRSISVGNLAGSPRSRRHRHSDQNRENSEKQSNKSERVSVANNFAGHGRPPVPRNQGPLCRFSSVDVCRTYNSGHSAICSKLNSPGIRAFCPLALVL